MEEQPNPQQAQFRPATAPQLPTTGYSPKLRDEKFRSEFREQEVTPPISLQEQAGAGADVSLSSTEGESTVSEAADKPYYTKNVEV